MARVFIVSSQGELRRTVECSDEHVLSQAHGDESIITVDPPSGSAYWDFHESLWVPIPDQPSPFHNFDWQSHEWVDARGLSQRQSDKWEEIKAARIVAFDVPLVTPFGTFQCDPESRALIESAANLARELLLAGIPENIDFTLLDNTVASLTCQQMIQVGLMLGARVQQVFAIGRQLRAAIYAPDATADSVAAISWPT